MSSQPVFLSNRQPLHLGRRLARGGEGEVFDIQNTPAQVAKIYHRALSNERRDKLAAMAQHLRTPALLQYTAWPLDTLHHGDGQICGFVMEKLAASYDIHELYSVKSRQQYFPNTDWRMLVRTALNTARAFAALHQAGFVIGDVNHGSVRVVPGSFVVKLIDTDSFQVEHAGRVFPCEVGMPEFTPPELQGVSFHSVARTANHDGFGLAVLIFQLLMNGWHPFSGVFSGVGEMTLKRAIQEMRYAHSAHAHTSQMQPPPACLPVAAASPHIAALWQAAFGCDAAGLAPARRPTAQDWVHALTALEANFAACAVNPAHHYWRGNTACPWCAMERGGVALFGSPVASVSAQSGAATSSSPAVPMTAGTGPPPLPPEPVRKKRWWASLFTLTVLAILVSVLVNIGNGNAQAQIGDMYRSGKLFFRQDEKKAVEWYRKAADKGHSSALFSILVIYEKNPDAYESDVSLVRKIANETLSNIAPYRLGRMYENGSGVTKNVGTALKLYVTSAGRENFDAQFRLGEIYFHGIGVAKNYEAAGEWFLKSLTNSGIGASTDKKSIAARNLTNVGVAYYHGNNGVSKNLDLFFSYTKKAAEMGNMVAQHHLGIAYQDGISVARNAREAVTWFTKAAEQGYAHSQFQLGYFYRDGYDTVISKDRNKAIAWFRKAAAQGRQEASQALRTMGVLP